MTVFNEGPFAVNWPAPPDIDLPSVSMTFGDGLFRLVDMMNDNAGDQLSVTVVGGTVDSDDRDLVYPSSKSEAAIEKVANRIPRQKARESIIAMLELLFLRRSEFYDIFSKYNEKSETPLTVGDVAKWKDKIAFIGSDRIPPKSYISRVAKTILGSGTGVLFVKGTPSLIEPIVEFFDATQNGDDIGFHIVVVDPSAAVAKALSDKGITRFDA